MSYLTCRGTKPICFFPPLLCEYEEFRPVVEEYFPGIQPYYMVSNYGRVYNYYTNNFALVKQHKNHNHFYVSIQFYINGKSIKKTIAVHRLMLATFRPVENLRELEVNHIDAIGQHNFLNNLEWCTGEENINKGFETNSFTYVARDRNPITKINENIAEEICKLYTINKMSINDIINKMNITRNIVESIIYGNSWKIIGAQYGLVNDPYYIELANKEKIRKITPISFFPNLLGPDEVFQLVNTHYLANVKPIYYVSTYGRVYNTEREILEYPIFNKRGDKHIYVKLDFINDNVIESIPILLENIVLSTFGYIDNCENMKVIHNDGLFNNNYVTNLRWINPEDYDNEIFNIRYVNNRELMIKRRRNEDVIQVCKLLQSGLKSKEIVKLTNHKESFISDIKRRRYYNYITKDYKW